MGRLSSTLPLLPAGTPAYSKNATRPMLDLTYGGQSGWTPDLGGLISNQAYISRPLTCVVLEYPKIFDIFENSAKWISSFKSLFELHARTIDGFNAGLKVDVEEHPVGGAGEMQQEFTNVTRERTQPKFSFIEKYGRPCQTLIEYWIRYGMMDPETKFALGGYANNTGTITDLLSDIYSATCLFFVPDPLNKYIDKAWMTTNMFPLSNGDVTAKRDLTSAQEMLTLDIEFTGVSQYGLGVNNFAQIILNNMNKNPIANHTVPDPFAKEGQGLITLDGTNKAILDNSDGYANLLINTAADAASNQIARGK